MCHPSQRHHKTRRKALAHPSRPQQNSGTAGPCGRSPRPSPEQGRAGRGQLGALGVTLLACKTCKTSKHACTWRSPVVRGPATRFLAGFLHVCQALYTAAHQQLILPAACPRQQPEALEVAAVAQSPALLPAGQAWARRQRAGRCNVSELYPSGEVASYLNTGITATPINEGDEAPFTR